MRAAFALVAALALGTALPARQPPNKSELLAAAEKQVRAATESVGPSVACVVASKSDRYGKPPADAPPGKLGTFDPKEFLKLNTAPGDARVAVELDLADTKNIPDHGFACGLVVDASGLILTPYHAVEGATKVFVHLPGKVGSYADIHAADARYDLAVLKLINPPAGLTPVKFADVRLPGRGVQKPTVDAGTFAVVVASSHLVGFALDKSATWAWVFKIPKPTGGGTPQSESYYTYGPFLEIEARPATDGAAVLNLDGEVIGLTTSLPGVPAGAQTPAPVLQPGMQPMVPVVDRGLLYAFPADAPFRRVVDVLKRGEEVEYGYLGVSMQTGGLHVTTVTPRGPAARAGIQGPLGGGDTITHADGVPISGYEELLHHVGGALAGNKVKLRVQRGRDSHDFDVALGKFQHKQASIASVRPEPVFGLRVDYGGPLAMSSGGRPDGTGLPDGVSVRELVPNSPAAAALKKLGDRPDRWQITHVNGAAVATPAAFYKAVKGQASVKLTVRDPGELTPRDREVTIP